MYRYKNLLVGLDLDDNDEVLVRYAELVSFMGSSSRVRFAHVYPGAAAFSELYPEFLVSMQAASEELQGHLDALAADHFVGPPNVEVLCTLAEGSSLPELLRLARQDDVDLVIVGKDQHGRTLAEKLARKAPCSVLVVPPEVPAVIERVLVPVDFSSHAGDAVDVAVGFAEAAGLEEIHLLHVYNVPTTYLRAGRSFDEFHDLVQQRTEERFETFLAELDLRGLRAVPHFAEGEDVPKTIHDEAETIGADLILVGTRGRSASAAVLLGSVGENVVRTSEVPVVAVKRKGTTLGLLDALFEL